MTKQDMIDRIHRHVAILYQLHYDEIFMDCIHDIMVSELSDNELIFINDMLLHLLSLHGIDSTIQKDRFKNIIPVHF